MSDQEFDTSRWAKEYAAHVDRWMEGKESLIPIQEFVARKVAAHLVDQYLAEQGLLVA